ncbi:hypothetical protein [Streptomyces sp. NPDC002533]
MNNSMGYSFPIVIGVVIAAVCITQNNYGGAIFAVVVGAGVSLALRFKSRRK